MIKFRCKVFSKKDKKDNFLRKTKTEVVRFVKDPKKKVGGYIDGYVEDMTETPVGTVVSGRVPIVGSKIYKKTPLPKLERGVWDATGVNKLMRGPKKFIRKTVSSKSVGNGVKTIEESVSSCSYSTD